MKRIVKLFAAKLLQAILLITLSSNVLYAGVTDGGVTAFRPDSPTDFVVIFTDNPGDDPLGLDAPLGVSGYDDIEGVCGSFVASVDGVNGLVCHGAPGDTVDTFTCDGNSESQSDSLWCLFSENPRSGNKAWAVKFTAGLIPTNDGDSIVRCEGFDTFDPATGCTPGVAGALPTQVNINGGYLKLDISPDGGPLDTDCQNPPHHGRMIVDSANSTLYFCTLSGWIILGGV